MKMLHERLVEHQGGICGHLHLFLGSLEGAAIRRCTMAIDAFGEGFRRKLDEVFEHELAVRKEAVHSNSANTVLSIEVTDRGRGLASTHLDIRARALVSKVVKTSASSRHCCLARCQTFAVHCACMRGR